MATPKPKTINALGGLVEFSPKQMEAFRILMSGKCKFFLYGGAAAGGKSFFLRWYLVLRLMYLGQKYGLTNLAAMMCCEDYPALRDRQIQKMALEFPPYLGSYHKEHSLYATCFKFRPEYGGHVILLRNLDDPEKYKSAEYCVLAIDELTLNEKEVFDNLWWRIRWPGIPEEEWQFVAATNPTGIGAAWVKQLWVDGDFPDDFRHVKYPDGTIRDYTKSFFFVPAKASDNPRLPPGYEASLGMLPPAMRSALRDGSWDIFIGQAFPELTHKNNGIDPEHPEAPWLDVPDNAELLMSFDWGAEDPFAIGWHYIDHEGRMVLFHELYGWSGVADKGARMSDNEIRDMILAEEREMGFEFRQDIDRVGGRDCFGGRWDSSLGCSGPTTAEVFAEKGIFLRQCNPDRVQGIRAFRNRIRPTPPDVRLLVRKIPDLRVSEHGNQFDGSRRWVTWDMKEYTDQDIIQIAKEKNISFEGRKPMYMAFNTCTHFWRTVPRLMNDKIKVEDVNTKGEDHMYDMARYAIMSQPLYTDSDIDITLTPGEQYIKDLSGFWEEETHTYNL